MEVAPRYKLLTLFTLLTLLSLLTMFTLLTLLILLTLLSQLAILYCLNSFEAKRLLCLHIVRLYCFMGF